MHTKMGGNHQIGWKIQQKTTKKNKKQKQNKQTKTNTLLCQGSLYKNVLRFGKLKQK